MSNSWSERIKPQPMFDVLSMARKRELEGHYVARMEIGDTPGFKNLTIHSLVEKHASSPYRYSPSRGEPSLIDKVIETQWPNYSPENVVVGPANFLITAALASETSPGDTVLLPDPGFPSYKLAADFLGLKIVYYPLNSNQITGFPDLKVLVKALPNVPKVIIVNNPSNPLGIAFDGSLVLQSLKDVLNLGIKIILDETYVNLVYDSTDISLGNIPATRLRSFSKEHCSPGLRIGYAVGTGEVARTMANLMSLSISCVPQFIQFAVAEYLGSDESIEFTNKLKEEMSFRMSYLAEAVPKGLLQTKPNAAFYALINIGNLGGEAAFAFMLERNVSTCPGVKFGENARNSVRISLAGSKDNFEKDIEMLTSALTEWNNKSVFYSS